MSESRILQGLNFEQRAAASIINGPVCTNAGPGSGKTRTLTHSIAYRIEQGAEPNEIVAITFTNKAKDEIKNRIGQLLGDGVSRKVFVGTYHSFLSANILMPNKRHPLMKGIGYKDGFVIADSDEADKILDEAIKEMPGPMRALYNLAELKPRDIKDFMAKYRASGLFAKTYIDEFSRSEIQAKKAFFEAKPSLDILATSPGSEFDAEKVKRIIQAEPKLVDFCKLSAWRSYEERMKLLNAVDYDGMLVLSKFLLEQDKTLRQAISAEIRHILLDEFQDTNNVQWDCMKLIIDEMDTPNVMVVGDPDQCIYQFRCANPQIMRDFQQIFPNASMKYLTTNYRTTSENVGLSNVIKGFIDPANLDHPMQAYNKTGALPLYKFFRDEKDEAEFVIQEIKERISAGVPKDKIAVLYRGKAQRKVVEAALTEAHLPYRIVGDISFYETKEVKDTIAMLRMIANEDDILGFTRGISASTIAVNGLTMRHDIENSKRSGKELSPMEYLYQRFTPKKITPAAQEKMLFWVNLKDLIKSSKGISTDEFIFNWMREGFEEADSPLAQTLTVERAMELYQAAKEQGVLNPLFEEDMEQSRSAFHDQVISSLKQFFDKYYLEKLKSYSEKNDNRIPEQQENRLQERLSNVEQVFTTLHAKLMEKGDFEAAINDLMLLTEQAEDNDMDGVQLMTIHASKGLEFNTVFLIGTEQKSYFSQSTVEMDYEAEACAFFVGTSRAEELNIMTGAKGRTINGQYDNNGEELIFIKNLPKNVFVNATDPMMIPHNNGAMSYLSDINDYQHLATNNQKGTNTNSIPLTTDGQVSFKGLLRSM